MAHKVLGCLCRYEPKKANGGRGEGERERDRYIYIYTYNISKRLGFRLSLGISIWCSVLRVRDSGFWFRFTAQPADLELLKVYFRV